MGQDMCGVAPAISLYDFRVLDKDGAGTEFSIMSALQFIRDLNTGAIFWGSPFGLESLKAFLAGAGRVQQQARADVAQALAVLAANDERLLNSWRESLGLFRGDNF